MDDTERDCKVWKENLEVTVDEYLRGTDMSKKDIMDLKEYMAVGVGEQTVETDSSISILEMPWLMPINTYTTQTEARDVFPDFVDPLFLDYCFIIPDALRAMVERMSTRRFVYRVGEDRVFKIVMHKTNEVVCSLDVLDFEEDKFDESNANVALVVNRNKYRNYVRVQQNSEYRTAMEQGTKYCRGVDAYSERNNELYKAQVRRGMNFIFINDPQDLVDGIKAILKHLSSRRVYIPKTKVFTTAQKVEHLQNFLQSIPGIGKCAAKSLSSHFGSIKELYHSIKHKGDSMLELKIWDEEGMHCRPLGKKQYSKIKAAFEKK